MKRNETSKKGFVQTENGPQKNNDRFIKEVCFQDAKQWNIFEKITSKYHQVKFNALTAGRSMDDGEPVRNMPLVRIKVFINREYENENPGE